jgi:hypothetical protein
MTSFLDDYFARIGYTAVPAVNLETLRTLHLQHNSRIPFENIEVVLPREIELSDEAIFNKLVLPVVAATALSKMACLSGYYAKSALKCAACWGAWCCQIRRICRRARTVSCW